MSYKYIVTLLFKSIDTAKAQLRAVQNQFVDLS